MINPFKETNWNPDLDQRRAFARSLVIGFPCIAAFIQVIQLSTGKGFKPGLLWLAIIGAGIGTVLWLIPRIAKPFYVLWFGLACTIGIVASNLLIALFYYLVITPTGGIMRLFGRDPLHRRFDSTRETYWDEPEQNKPAERYYRQF